MSWIEPSKSWIEPTNVVDRTIKIVDSPDKVTNRKAEATNRAIDTTVEYHDVLTHTFYVAPLIIGGATIFISRLLLCAKA